jgi:hypothetical protein
MKTPHRSAHAQWLQGAGHTMRRHVVGTILVIAALIAIVLSYSAAWAQAGDASRATDADRVQLARDIGRLVVAENRFAMHSGAPGWLKTPRSDATKQISMDRQRQLLGVDEHLDPKALAEEIRAWWVKHVLQPALDVAANPAASCEITMDILSRILTLQRQGQLLGLDDETFGDFGNSESVLSRALNAAKERCLAQAFDECLATGNGEALKDLVGKFGRQLEILGLPEQAEQFAGRGGYLFRRCCVYKLIYHIETRTPDINLSVVDGSFTLLFEPAEGEPIRGLTLGQWLAHQEKERAPDVQLTSIDCRQPWNSDPLLTCGPGATPSIRGQAFGQVELRRTFTKQIIETVEDPKDFFNPVIRILFGPPQTKGQNQVTLDFLPSLLQVPMVVTKKGTRLFTGMTAAGHELLYINEESGPIMLRLQGWRRDGYPTLFRADMPVKGAKGSRGDHRFELVHRPDLFPPDQIVADWEVSAPVRPEPPPRIPAQTP